VVDARHIFVRQNIGLLKGFCGRGLCPRLLWENAQYSSNLAGLVGHFLVDRRRGYEKGGEGGKWRLQKAQKGWVMALHC